MTQEVLKLALEALENPNAGLVPHKGEWRSVQSIAITALKEALAQPEQEPVAWMYVCNGDEENPVLVNTQKDWAKSSWWHEIPLYTTPSQRTEQLKACVYCGQLVAKEKNNGV
jgi:hypothetical protein